MKDPKPNDRCPCGSRKKYKKCCGDMSKIVIKSKDDAFWDSMKTRFEQQIEQLEKELDFARFVLEHLNNKLKGGKKQ